jgi:2'-5' RNA ligase
MTLWTAVAVPRGEMMAQVEAIRLRYDPLARQLPAHVTLVFPFDSDIVGAALRSHVKHAAASASPFAVRLECIVPLDDHHLAATITTGSDSIVGLHDRLYTGALAAHRSRVHRFAPHVTVGRFGERSAVEAALKELPSTDLRIDTTITAVTIWALTHDGVRTAEIPLT